MKTQRTEGGFSYPPVEETSNNARSFFNPRAAIDSHRRRLPHWQQGEVPVFVTWRLADSLPREMLEFWKTNRDGWMKQHPKPWDAQTEIEYHDRFSRQLDEWLDEGHGSCLLRDAAAAGIVADALRYFNGERYQLFSYIVMPNHVHVVFAPRKPHPVKAIVKSWKGFTAWKISKEMKRAAPLWQEEYWDRLIRSERHFFKCAEYIRGNPVKAKLSDGEYLLFEAELP